MNLQPVGASLGVPFFGQGKPCPYERLLTQDNQP
jgi:hypothetical protein